MTIKKKTSKKVLKRKRNPDLKSDYAFQMGYRIGKDDITQKQWELDDIYQSYVANISYLLINNEFRWSILNYQNWILGYIQAKLDFKYSDKLNELYYKIKNDKNYLNPVLADHSRVLLLIDQGVNKVKEDTLDYVNKNKIQWGKINSISIRLNQDESYTKWILKTSIKAPYLSADCEWICGGQGFAGLNVAQEVFEKKEIYASLIEKYSSDPEAVTLITNEVMKKELKNCKIKAENVSIDDSFNIRYRYANTFVLTAFFLALSGKISSDQLSMWLNTQYPQKLKELGLLEVGNFEPGVMQARFASVTDAVIESVIQKTFILAPGFKELSAELLATMFMIQFSQIVNTMAKDNCYKIIKASTADFSG